MDSNETIAPSSNFAAGLAVLCIAFENTGTNGADPVNSVTDTNGNTWTLRQNALRDPGGVSEGVGVRIYTSPQNGGLLTTGDIITVDMDDPATDFQYTLYQVSRGSNAASYVTGGSTNGGSGTSRSITTSSIANGNVVIGFVGIEDDAAGLTGDSDTTRGSWGTFRTNYTFGGSSCAQEKIVTAAGTQTYNVSWTGTRDNCAAWIELGP